MRSALVFVFLASAFVQAQPAKTSNEKSFVFAFGDPAHSLEVTGGTYFASQTGPNKNFAITAGEKGNLTMVSRKPATGDRRITALLRLRTDMAASASARTDEQIARFIRERADTIYHPVGSCRMGPGGEFDVVDARLRVHGVQGLRVVDASIMPRIVSGNTNAPTVMVAEKAADMVKADARRPGGA